MLSIKIISLQINVLTFKTFWPNMKNILMALLVSISTRKSTSIYFQAWYETPQSTSTKVANLMTATSTRRLMDHPMQWKFGIKKLMVVPLVKWYHPIIDHPGYKCSRMTIEALYYHPNIRRQLNKFNFKYCQFAEFPCKGP